MLPALLVLAGAFALLFLFRLGAARRNLLIARWPAAAFAIAALLAISRGAVWPALALAGISALFWFFPPELSAPRASAPIADSPAAAEARRLLGVSQTATAAEIRRAYRERMRRAHPDRGGMHEHAARLTAARDLLLKRQP